MSALLPTIGLEVHAELNTRSKLFCSCPNNPDEKEPNLNICPVCLGHPGTLPVLNKAAVMAVLRVGLALRGRLADFSEFDRKNYFYPDIPKGYQISQYKYPLVSGGELLGVQLTRIHLEEDTARSQHDTHATHSLVDFNRAGVPLMELVTEPVITSAKQAADFGRELQLLLRYLEVSEANLEKGEMRIEANISIAPAGSRGTKVEVKNLNSFRSVERAIEYELKRQQELLEAGEKIVQETRGWDEVKATTFSQRQKESSHDYRYFPEPDLPKLKLSEVPEFQNLAATLPELPWQKRERYIEKYDLKNDQLEFYIQDANYRGFFDEVVIELNHDKKLAQLASNYITSDLRASMAIQVQNTLRKLNTKQIVVEISLNFPSPKDFASLIKMISVSEISSRAAKDILYAMTVNGATDPRKIAEEKNLFQKSDENHLAEIIRKVIADNEKVVTDYKAGKQGALQFLIGQSMKESKGAGNPEVLKELLIASLSK